MSLYDGIITKKSDNDKDREQSERAAPSSLYANLLPSFSAAVIEQQPVKYKTSNQTSSSLRFKPTRRKKPQRNSSQKNRSREIMVLTKPSDGTTNEDKTDYTQSTTIKDYDNLYGRNQDPDSQYWAETYDPMSPNRFQDYIASVEYFMELDDWKDYLLHSEEPDAVQFVGAKGTENEKEDDETEENEQESGQEIEQENDNENPTSNELTSGSSSIGRRLMGKYGWKPGTGLGRQSSGIIKPLHFAMSKKWPGRGRIIDKNARNPGKFGPASRVVKVSNMVTVWESTDLDILSKLGQQFERILRIVLNGKDIFVKFGDYFQAFRVSKRTIERGLPTKQAINELKDRYTISYHDEHDFERSVY